LYERESNDVEGSNLEQSFVEECQV